MRRVVFLIALTLLAWTPMAGAATLSADDQAAVERVRAYLNDLTTLEARFQQTDGAGNVATGRFWLHRPNRLRFEYDPPNPILIVARGSFLVHYDKALKESHYLDQEDTPAWFLLAKEVQFDQNIIIRGVHQDSDQISITAQQKGREDEGAITLVFQRSPLKLLGWNLMDAGGGQVHLRLLEQTVGGEIDPDLFQFRPTDYGPAHRSRNDN